MTHHDIEFVTNDGEHKGKKYRFTLASKNGVKQWAVTPLYEPPPSIIKEKIEMSLTAQEGNIPSSGAIELKPVNKILDQLKDIALESDVRLVGYDQKERPVLIDETGFSLTCVTNETGREPEYAVNLTCWGLYE